MEQLRYPHVQNISIKFVQRRPSVFDVGPTLYKCYRFFLCLLGMDMDSVVISRAAYWMSRLLAIELLVSVSTCSHDLTPCDHMFVCSLHA